MSWHSVSLRWSAHTRPLVVHTWTRIKGKTLLCRKAARFCERVLDTDRARADRLDRTKIEASRAGGLGEAEARNLRRRCRGHCAREAGRHAWWRGLVRRRMLLWGLRRSSRWASSCGCFNGSVCACKVSGSLLTKSRQDGVQIWRCSHGIGFAVRKPDCRWRLVANTSQVIGGERWHCGGLGCAVVARCRVATLGDAGGKEKESSGWCAKLD